MSDGITIVRDTREKKPYGFGDYSVSTVDKTLETGDYTVEGHENEFAIERKTKSDFLSSITHDRDRFENEFKRASELDRPLVVLVESPLIHFERGYYYPDVSSSSVIGTIDAWSDRYNAEFVFTQDRCEGEKQTYLNLIEWALK
jgi:ERCC4-type nuclease